MSTWKLYHKKHAPGLFKKKNDTDWGGQKDTESEQGGGDIRERSGGEGCKAGEGGKNSRIYKWKHERPLYLELLKIAPQMVAGASWPNAALSSQAGGIDRQGAVGEASRSLQPTVAEGGRRGGVEEEEEEEEGEARRGEEWSGAEWELFFALLD